MSTARWRASAAGVLLAALAALLLPACAAEPDLGLGARIYREGLGTGGRALVAQGVSGAELTGAQAACAVCHRRSGMGGREGTAAVSPVTGPLLFSKPVPYWPARRPRPPQPVQPLRQDARSAYDAATLVRAIRDGIDPDGRTIDPLMPRYPLDDAEAAALVAYLRQLGTAPIPGFDGGRLHLATVVTPDADPTRARVVTEAMTAWSRSGALGGLPMTLHVWRLQGPPAEWPAQLQAAYARQPVYAVLSGAGGSAWTPVRDFCEASALPCLFPIVDLAPEDPADFYAMYFSRGVPLEAAILARTVADLDPAPTRVVQLAAGAAGTAAARQFAALLADAAEGLPVETRPLSEGAPGGELLAGIGPRDVVVGWLDSGRLAAVAQRWPDGPGGGLAVFSAQLAPPEQLALPEAWRRQARWISLRSDPARRAGKGVIGLLPWRRQLKLPDGDDALHAEVYAATYYFGDALARMRGHWSREFLLETLESASYARPAGSAFVLMSLGPGQREAAKAAQLLRFDGPTLSRLVAEGRHLTP